MSHIKQTFQYGNHTVTLETNEIARQADAAVLLTIGGTVILATVVAQKEAPQTAQGFFPLTVHYIEKTYAAGRIPGGYFKREGRPSELEILISRLIDRTLRPLFPDGFENEVQIIVTVLSLDPNVSTDIPALIAASAAVSISGIPFNGPVGAARVAYQDSLYSLNPTAKQLESSALDLVVAGTRQAVLMVESEAKELSEKIMLGAVTFGHTQMQSVIDGINAFVAAVNNPRWNWHPPTRNQSLDQQIAALVSGTLAEAYQVQDKSLRQARVAELRSHVMTQLAGETPDKFSPEVLKEAFHHLESQIVRDAILAGKPRIDGRDTKTVRTIAVRTGLLPFAHGSALFTRGETQALVVSTLGTPRDAQVIDALAGEIKDRFMLHYNFPPFSVGEIGMVSGPKRREIGHGRLARRALQAVLPGEKDFPYVLRVVSEITESNGSSSMATVCGASLSLMDAGVPIKAPVAGIAMGLVKENESFVVLTDILGDEDHLGDMDFKVAGTAAGVTALQMDIKIEGITPEIMEVALEQAKNGRLYILEIMNNTISQARDSVSDHAPRLLTIKIDPDKIRDVIGKGGATIRALTEETGATIDIQDDGTVTIAAVDRLAGEAALSRIQAITSDIEVGGVYTGKVTRLADFGAFVMLPSGKEGLLHISQIRHERVEKVSDCFKEGDVATVKVLEIDRQGRIRLSMKALQENVKEPAVEEANSAAIPDQS